MCNVVTRKITHFVCAANQFNFFSVMFQRSIVYMNWSSSFFALIIIPFFVHLPLMPYIEIYLHFADDNYSWMMSSIRSLSTSLCPYSLIDSAGVARFLFLSFTLLSGIFSQIKSKLIIIICVAIASLFERVSVQSQLFVYVHVPLRNIAVVELCNDNNNDNQYSWLKSWTLNNFSLKSCEFRNWKKN